MPRHDICVRKHSVLKEKNCILSCNGCEFFLYIYISTSAESGLYYLFFLRGNTLSVLYCSDFNFVFLRRPNSRESVTVCMGSIVLLMHRGTLQIKSKWKCWVCFRFHFTVRMVNTSVCVTNPECIILWFSEVIYNWIIGCFMILWNGIYRRQY